MSPGRPFSTCKLPPPRHTHTRQVDQPAPNDCPLPPLLQTECLASGTVLTSGLLPNPAFPLRTWHLGPTWEQVWLHGGAFSSWGMLFVVSKNRNFRSTRVTTQIINFKSLLSQKRNEHGPEEDTQLVCVELEPGHRPVDTPIQGAGWLSG